MYLPSVMTLEVSAYICEAPSYFKHKLVDSAECLFLLTNHNVNRALARLYPTDRQNDVYIKGITMEGDTAWCSIDRSRMR